MVLSVVTGVVVVLARGKELRKLVIIALLQVFTEGKHILYAHPTPHSLPGLESWAGSCLYFVCLASHSPPLLPAGIVS